jgi:serine/threonine protein kinase
LTCEFGRTEVDRRSVADLLGVEMDEIPRKLFICQEVDFTSLTHLKRGTYANVHDFGRYVIKVVTFCRDEAKKFVNELKIWSEFPYHRNIVQFVGLIRPKEIKIGEIEMAFVLDKYERSLKEVVASSESFTLEQQMESLHQISIAIAYLHSREIVHRDLHPNNILAIGYDRFAVTDFDRSFDLRKPETQEDIKNHSGMYDCICPPEALSEDEMIGPPSDVFSFGVLIWHVLTFRDLQADLLESKRCELHLHEWIKKHMGKVQFCNAEPSVKDRVCDLLVSCLEESIVKRPSAEHVRDEFAKIKKIVHQN